MNNKELIASELAKVIDSLDQDAILNLLEQPKSSDLGDIAFPAFSLAKVERKAPQAIAADIAEKIDQSAFEKVVATGPYVNFFLDKSKISDQVIKSVIEAGADYGQQDEGHGQNITIDLSSPNIAKPFSVGHLRSTVIGDALSNIFRKMGYNTIKINHLGDWGKQFGLLMVAYKKWGSKEAVEANPIDELLKLYVRINAEIENDPELDEEGRKWFKKLEDGDPEATELWQWFRDESLVEFNRIYKLLGVEFDSLNGEAFYNDKMDVVVNELKENTFKKHDCMTVAEAPGVPYEELEEFIGEDGYFSMIFDFRYADLDVASGSEWFKRVPWTIKDLNQKIMDSQMALQKCGWGANFIENHDQPRATTKYLKENQDNKDAVKTLAAMYFLLRGTPFIYQGQELGMVNFQRKGIEEFNDISSIDQYYRAIDEGLTERESLRAINLRSRDNTRTPFPWNGQKYGGFSTEKPWLKMTEEHPKVNAVDQVGREGSIYQFYKEMINFRQNSEYKNCLVFGNIEPMESSENVIAYRRYTEDESIECWFNLGVEEVTEELKDSNVEVIWGNMKQVELKQDHLTLKPFQTVLLKEKKED